MEEREAMSRKSLSPRNLNRRPKCNAGNDSKWASRAGVERLESRTLLTTVAVSTINDVVDGNTTSLANLIASPGLDGKISLREAILAANNSAGANQGDLPAGIYTFTIGGGQPPATPP